MVFALMGSIYYINLLF